MGTMNEAFSLFKDKTGYDAKRITFFTWLAWVIFAGMLVGAIHLSAHGLQEYIWKLLGLYMVFVALPLLFSPVLWFMFGFGLYVIGQFGGKKGLSFNDGVEEVKKWGVPALNKGGYVLLMAIPLWFIAMGLLNTKGYEDFAYIFLVITPLLIYLCQRAWPKGESFEAFIRWSLILLAVGIAILMVYNTFNRATTDKDVQVVQDYQNERAAAAEANKTRVAERIRKKLEKAKAHTLDEEKAALTPKEWEVWQLLSKKASGASGVQGAAGKARQAIEQAKPDDLSWWTAHWYIPAGILAVIVLVAMLARKKSGATGATGASQGSGHGILTSHWWLDTILGLIIAMVLYLLWYNGPGWYETVSIPVTSMKERKVCLLRDLPNKPMRFIVPNEERGAIRARIEEVSTGQSPDSDLAASIIIEGANRSQTFQGGKQCLWVKWAIEGGEGIRVVDEVVIPVKILVAHKWNWLNKLAELFA